MTSPNNVLYNLLLLSIYLLLTGCGASTGNTTPSSNAERITGIDGIGTGLPGDVTKVTSIGAINSDSNSINGTEYDISQSTIIIDGALRDSAQFSSGQVVSVKSLQDTTGLSIRLAESIEAMSLVRGNASLSDDGNLNILKQTIIVNEDTSFGNNLSAESELAGSDLQVSGYRLTDGSIAATLIEQSTLDQQVVGNISGLEPINGQFFINSLAINVSEVGLNNTIENGSSVLVKGTTFDTQGRLIAETIIDLDDPAEGSDLVEIEGFITSKNGLFEFNIANNNFVVNSSTIYTGGNLADIAIDTKVRAFTKTEVDGRLIAQEIVFLRSTLLGIKAGDSLPSDEVVFKWSDVDADEYSLRVVAVDGDKQTLFEQYFNGNIFSTKVTGLPQIGAKIDIVLGTRHGGNWDYSAIRVNGQALLPTAELINLDELLLLSSKSATFRWTDVGADEYRLVIFSDGVLFDRTTINTEISVDNLPSNSAALDIYLYTRNQDLWDVRKYNIKSAGLIENSVLTSHTNNQALNSETEVFSWSDSGAEQYRIKVYAFLTNRPILDETLDSSTLSYTVSNLPETEAEVVVKIYSYHDGWGVNTYTFQGNGTLDSSKITSHIDGDPIAESDIITWSVPTYAEAVTLKITSVNSNEEREVLHHKTYSPDTNSLLIEDLPTDGSRIDITASSLYMQWWTQDYIRLRPTNLSVEN